MGLGPPEGMKSRFHPEPFACHSERSEESAVCSLRVNFAKDLQFRSENDKCRFFASLRMTDSQASRDGEDRPPPSGMLPEPCGRLLGSHSWTV